MKNLSTCEFNEELYSNKFINVFDSDSFKYTVIDKLSPNDLKLLDAFISELDMLTLKYYNYRDCLKDAKIFSNIQGVNLAMEYYYKAWYFSVINTIFKDAPKTMRYKNIRFSGAFDDYMENYYDNLKVYIVELYYLFRDIVKNKINYNFLGTIKTENENGENFNIKELQKFLAKMVINGKKIGARIDGSVKKIGALPVFMKSFFYLENNHYYLKNNDIYSLDFKLAILSVLPFQNTENAKIFMLKIMQWKNYH